MNGRCRGGKYTKKEEATKQEFAGVRDRRRNGTEIELSSWNPQNHWTTKGLIHVHYFQMETFTTFFFFHHLKPHFQKFIKPQKLQGCCHLNMNLCDWYCFIYYVFDGFRGGGENLLSGFIHWKMSCIVASCLQFLLNDSIWYTSSISS